MAREATHRTLEAFGVAVVNLERAIEEHAPFEEIIEWDRVVADRTREVINLVEMLRSRIGLSPTDSCRTLRCEVFLGAGFRGSR